jgi:hypothetical protein
MTRRLDLLARAVPPLLLALLALRLLQAVPAHSLWQDEWATLELSFAPTSWVERLYFLSGPADAHFPTFYVVTRLLGELLAYAGQSTEALVRLPATLLTLGALFLTGRWALPRERSPSAAWVAAGLVGVLLTAGDWAQHAGEGRMYGLMGALGMAMVLAAARGRAGAACACGLTLAILHPFGALVGFAPALAALAGARLGLAERMGLERHQLRRMGGWALAAFLVAGLWIQMKFIGHQTGGYGLRRRGGDMATVLSGLSPWAAGLLAAVALAGLAAVLAARRRTPAEAAPGPGTFAALTGAALCLTLGLGVAALAVARPGVNVAMPRYVAWINPALWTGAAAGLALLVDAWAAGLARLRTGAGARPRLAAVLALGGALLAGAWSFHLLRVVPLGPPWGDGLREAAGYLQTATGPGDAVTTDTRELFRFFPPYTDGYACRRSPQLVPYLTPELRARIPCQDSGGRVTFGPDIRRVFLVREPVPVSEGRTVVLDGFQRAGEVRFANTVVERWGREPGRDAP